jgi:hypothetical protein
MAYRVGFMRRFRRVIKMAMKKVRVALESDEKPSLAVSPQLILDPTKMGLSGLGRDMAEEFADDLKALITRQLIAWVPLSPGYAKRKRMLGLDPRILIATGRYVNSIQPIAQPDGSWVVSVPNEPLRSGSKYTLKDLARWLEYGTRHMPARPHWRPARNIWRTKMVQIKQRLKFNLVQELRKQGYR